MAMKDISSCRGTLDFLKEENELLVIDNEVDPMLEVSGITKALDNGLALLFRNVKGYPNQRILTGLFSRGERVTKIFNVSDPRKLKFKGLEAIKNPIPPTVVDSGPCQEIVITDDIDVLKAMPITQHTETDAGRVLSGGIVLINGANIGNCISYKRTHFRGKDWASMAFYPGSHFEYWVLQCRKETRNLPLTINICPSPAVQVVAGGGFVPLVIPVGTDELAIAGGIQEVPVKICKARTVDAYAIANSEWVIEGYIDTSQVVWESEEGEKRGDSPSPFFPESHGHVGRARSTYKFKATAITHRKDNPIFYAPLAHSFEYHYMATFVNDAALFELLNRRYPGLVIDVNTLHGMMGLLGTVIQVKKQTRRDEEHIRDLILAAWASCSVLRTVVVVDEDVDIYNADEIIWALNTRINPNEDLILMSPGTTGKVTGPAASVWRIAFDATVPFKYKQHYSRGEFLKVDLERWLTRNEIAGVRALQSEYARLLAKKGV